MSAYKLNSSTNSTSENKKFIKMYGISTCTEAFENEKAVWWLMEFAKCNIEEKNFKKKGIELKDMGRGKQ